MNDKEARRAIQGIIASCETLESELKAEIAALKKENGVLKRKIDAAEAKTAQALSIARQAKAIATGVEL
jgi:hypothetical protein